MPVSTQRARPRAWYVDALAALAFFVQAVALGRVLRVFPFFAFFAFAASAGVGWYFCKAAWRGLVEARR
jgi:hypothetical protein